MPVLLRINVPAARMGQLEYRLGVNVHAVVRTALARMQRDVVQRAKERTLQLHVYDTGRVYDGWYAIPRSFDELLLKNRARHTPYVVSGRRAGARMPPSSALVPWVRRHFPVTAKGARGLAFVIARKIAERGIRAKPITTASTFQREIGRMVNSRLRDETLKIMRRR